MKFSAVVLCCLPLAVSALVIQTEDKVIARNPITGHVAKHDEDQVLTDLRSGRVFTKGLGEPLGGDTVFISSPQGPAAPGRDILAPSRSRSILVNLPDGRKAPGGQGGALTQTQDLLTLLDPTDPYGNVNVNTNPINIGNVLTNAFSGRSQMAAQVARGRGGSPIVTQVAGGRGRSPIVAQVAGGRGRSPIVTQAQSAFIAQPAPAVIVAARGGGRSPIVAQAQPAPAVIVAARGGGGSPIVAQAQPAPAVIVARGLGRSPIVAQAQPAPAVIVARGRARLPIVAQAQQTFIVARGRRGSPIVAQAQPALIAQPAPAVIGPSFGLSRALETSFIAAGGNQYMRRYAK